MRHLIIIITALLALASCDIVDFDVDYGEFPECEMTLDRHNVYVMVGDYFQVTPIFTPDTLPNREVYYTEPRGLLEFDTERFLARREGNTLLYAISVQQRLKDSCNVYVMKPWELEVDDYPYDMVIYAAVTLNGQPFDPSTMQVAAFVDGECRGVGVPRTVRGINYLELRIGSEMGQMMVDGDDDDDNDDDDGEDLYERVRILLYDRNEQMVYHLKKSIVFDEEAHGTLSDLFPLDF